MIDTAQVSPPRGMLAIPDTKRGCLMSQRETLGVLTIRNV